MSGYFKDTGEMVGDIRGGFRAGAPVAAAAGMLGITIFVELVKTAFFSWRAMLFWKVLLCGLLVIAPFHIGLFYGFPFNPSPKLTIIDWIIGELIIYINLSISFFYYAKRYRTIEKKLGLNVDDLHYSLVTHATKTGIAVFLAFVIVYLGAIWLISLVPWFQGQKGLGVTKQSWWVFGSDKSMIICYGWMLFLMFGMWLYCLVEFKDSAIYYIRANSVKNDDETDEEFLNRQESCITSLDWSWKGIRGLIFFQMKLIIGLVVFAIITFAVLYLTKKLGIWH